MDRDVQDIWAEALRTANLVRMADEGLSGSIGKKVLFDGLTGEDAKSLLPLVDDALILVRLLEQLERRGVVVREP